MPKTTHTATLPDGSIAKRVSQSRVYSHVVIGRRLYDVDLARAKAPAHQRGDRSNYAYWRSFIDDAVERYRWETPEETAARREKGLAEAVEAVGAYADADAYVAAQLAARTAQVEADHAGGEIWHALTWASREDLALRACRSSEWAGYLTRAIPCERS
jgi:hypothetical protein